ncbi:MAG: 5'-methylthioadenosine/S-adenosylhomocysteine nucleosidase [Bacteroidales bacterium]|nr:5'-methylthioadenosine/S-adenosylhomocysteine nucleosidase [Bacteroidales bacterium]
MKTGLIVAMTSEYEALRAAGVSGVVKSGIGKADAARAATELILNDRPDCIINSGCAGGIAPGLKICDIVVGAQTAYHDAWCGDGFFPGQIQGQPRRFDADPQLLQAALSLKVDKPLHSGLICSGDQFLTTPQDDARVLSIYPDALACDMESAAIAQVCRYYGVPFLSFRMISDVHTSHEEAEAAYQGFWTRLATDSFSFIKQLTDSL